MAGSNELVLAQAYRLDCLRVKGHKVEIHVEAQIDYFNQVEYLANEGRSLELLAAYVEEMIAADNAIAERPRTWPLARPSKRVRKFGPTKRFRFLVFYLICDDSTVRILNYCAPGRQPRWLGRL
jgi:hypothetical protein